MNTQEQKLLIQKAKSGDIESYEELIYDYKGKIISIVFLLGTSYTNALSISQQIFVNAYKSLKTYKSNTDFYIWLCSIAIEKCIEIFSSSELSNSETFDNDANILDLIDLDDKYAGQEFDVELFNSLKQAIDRLELNHKIVIILSNVFCFTPQIISEILKLPLPAVQTKIGAAKKHFHMQLMDI